MERLRLLRKMGWRQKEETVLLEELREIDESRLSRLRDLTEADGRWEEVRKKLIEGYPVADRLRFFSWEDDKGMLMRTLAGLRSLSWTKMYIRQVLPDEEKEAAELVIQVVYENFDEEDWRWNRELSSFLREMRSLMPGREALFKAFYERLSDMSPAISKEFKDA